LDIDVRERAFKDITASAPPLDHVADGITFGEGPVWDRRNKRFLFTDIIGDTIWQWRPGIGKEVLVHPSRHANGMTIDRQGRVVVAGWSARTIWRIEADGSFITLAERYQGRKFNSPNDIVVQSNGAIWFTDSPGALYNPGRPRPDPVALLLEHLRDAAAPAVNPAR